MKFYKIRYGDWGRRYAPEDQIAEWTTNRKEAERIAKDNADGDYESKIFEIDIPTDKAGLLDWLNNNVYR